MESHEAYDIIQSAGYVDVMYKDRTVWIEQINDDEKTVLVKDLDSDKEYLVSLEQLRKTDGEREFTIS
ncbi:MAG: small, acid-soluble spore protein, H family [Bacillota bacterium]|nr:small, acid-soluble spore protein, H family [Bacillota bacterium]